VKFAVERAVGAMGSASSGHRALGAKKRAARRQQPRGTKASGCCRWRWQKGGRC